MVVVHYEENNYRHDLYGRALTSQIFETKDKAVEYLESFNFVRKNDTTWMRTTEYHSERVAKIFDTLDMRETKIKPLELPNYGEGVNMGETVKNIRIVYTVQVTDDYDPIGDMMRLYGGVLSGEKNSTREYVGYHDVSSIGDLRDFINALDDLEAEAVDIGSSLSYELTEFETF